MRTLWSILVLCVLLGFGVSLAVPAEDVPETAYDESEGLPYEDTPLFSIVVSRASARIAKVELSGGSLPRFNSLANCCNGRRENNGRSPYVPNSLTIFNHSLRC
jgi:hypothetical protein